MIESIKEEQEKDWGNFFSLKNLVIHPQLIRKSQTISSPYYSCFLKDIEIVNESNLVDSYPIFMLPLSIQQLALKKPPIKSNILRPFSLDPTFLISFENKSNLYLYKKQGKEKEYKELATSLGIWQKIISYNKSKEEWAEVDKINNDRTKTFSIDEFINIANKLGYNLNEPTKPKEQSSPYLQTVTKKYNKEVNSLGKEAILFLLGVVFLILYFTISQENALLVLGVFYSMIIFLYSFLSGRIFKEDFWITTDLKTFSYSQSEIEELEKNEQIKFEIELNNYKTNILPIYEKNKKEYEQMKANQIESFKTLFPKICSSLWKKTMVANSQYNRSPEPPQRGISENSLFKELIELYPRYVKIDVCALSYFPDIMLDIDNKYFVDIEIDEPYEYKSKQETHYIGSKDDIRNQKFIENNWFVLRFTEEQINNNLTTCVCLIKELVDFILSGETIHLSNLCEISRIMTSPLWTKEEARLMSINNTRSKRTQERSNNLNMILPPNIIEVDDLPF